MNRRRLRRAGPRPTACTAASTSSRASSPTRWSASSAAAGCSSATSPRCPQAGDWVTRRHRAGTGDHGARPRRRDPRAGQPLRASRQRAVLGAERATSRSFQCTYHAWTFGLDGTPAGGPLSRRHSTATRPTCRSTGRGRSTPIAASSSPTCPATPAAGRAPRHRRQGADRPAVRPVADRRHPPVAPAGSGIASPPTGRCGPRATTTAITSTSCTPRC